MSADATGGYRLRRAREEDMPALLALHARAYHAHPRRSAAAWRWRHLEHPHARLELLLVEDAAGAPVAVHGGVRQRARLEGRPCFAGLLGDTAVDPRLAAGLASGRLLTRLLRAHFAAFAGAELAPLAWGFPEPPLRRLGVRHAGFVELRDLVMLVRPVAREEAAAPPGGLRVEHGVEPPADADALWTRCAPELPTAVVRDGEYLRWRYARHPDVDYALLAAREARGALRGLAVTRAGGWHPDVLAIMDWLVPRDDAEAEHALLAACEARARRARRSHLALWLAGDAPREARLRARHGFEPVVTPHRHCARWWRPELSAEELAAGWYQTLGDTDFF